MPKAYIVGLTNFSTIKNNQEINPKKENKKPRPVAIFNGKSENDTNASKVNLNIFDKG